LREGTVQARGGLPNIPVCLQLSKKPKHCLPLLDSQICFACEQDFATAHGSTGAAEAIEPFSDRSDRAAAIAKKDFCIPLFSNELVYYQKFWPRYKTCSLYYSFTRGILKMTKEEFARATIALGVGIGWAQCALQTAMELRCI
jgi:hypothetical protein